MTEIKIVKARIGYKSRSDAEKFLRLGFSEQVCEQTLPLHHRPYRGTRFP
jgi:hypothetical protein